MVKKREGSSRMAHSDDKELTSGFITTPSRVRENSMNYTGSIAGAPRPHTNYDNSLCPFTARNVRDHLSGIMRLTAPLNTRPERRWPSEMSCFRFRVP